MLARETHTSLLDPFVSHKEYELFGIRPLFQWRHDTQHNDIQHNDTQHNETQYIDNQHKGLIYNIQNKWQGITTLYHYADCHFAECHYAERNF